jgi:hypothetical protein
MIRQFALDQTSMLPEWTRQPSFALLLALAWLAATAQLMAANWAITAFTMHDADDAMRLVEVRAFLAGQGWYDLLEPRLGPAPGCVTHWSRLVDAGIAGLFLLLKPFAGAAFAERLTVAIWPMLWLLPAIGGVTAIAWRMAGREAAILVLLLAVFDMPGLQQFRPSRIDHHNVQIALAILAVAATVWADRVRWTAAAAGALTGLGLGIGLEAVHIYALCGVAFVLRYVLDRDAATPMRAYGIALAVSVVTALLATVGPAQWTQSVCDRLAVNSGLTLLLAGAGAAIMGAWLGDERRWVRCAAGCTMASVALAAGILLEPRCLAGPYGLIDPAIRPIWLADVTEDQSWLRLTQTAPSTGLALLAFPAMGALAVTMLAWTSTVRREFGPLLAGAACVLALATFIVSIRNYSYAIWFSLPLVAAAALQLFNRLKLTKPAFRLLPALVITPTAITLGAITIASAAGVGGLLDLNGAERQACVHRGNYGELARLPNGLLVTNELEWGPYLLAWTPHAVLAAPYHRLAAGIVANDQVFASPPEAAHRVLDRFNVSYIATCGSRGATALTGEARQASLWGRLQAGNIPDFLERVPPFGQAFAVYRVRR